MKIIKHGKPKSKTLRGKCSACGCQFECEQNEAKYQGPLPRGEGDFWRVNCPECRTELIIYP